MIASHDLRYQYPGQPMGQAAARTLAFPDVNLPAGGTLLVRGPSGCGKSTWLALVAGLRRPTSGRLVVAGQALADLPPRAVDAWRARHVGFVPQRLHLSDALTVAQNLALVYLAAGLPTDHPAIEAALRALDVSELAARKPSQLSGGQAQRVALARAVLLRPAVLLADEPTANLDDDAAQAALSLLLHTAQSCGACCVVATHDARVVRAATWSQTLLLSPPNRHSSLQKSDQPAAEQTERDA